MCRKSFKVRVVLGMLLLACACAVTLADPVDLRGVGDTPALLRPVDPPAPPHKTYEPPSPAPPPPRATIGSVRG